MLVEQERARWQKFRRALRREDQILLDEMLEDARRHGQAQSYASWATPYEAILVSMLLEQGKRIKRMEAELAAIRDRRQPIVSGQ